MITVERNDLPSAYVARKMLEERRFTYLHMAPGLFPFVQKAAGITATETQFLKFNAMTAVGLPEDFKKIHARDYAKLKHSIRMLEPYLNGIGKLHIESESKVTVIFYGSYEPLHLEMRVPGSAEKMTKDSVIEAARRIRQQYEEQVYEKIRGPLATYITQYGPEEDEGTQKKNDDTIRQEQEARAKALQEAFGEDLECMTVREQANKIVLFNKKHPEFWQESTVPEGKYAQSLKAAYISFKKKFDAYDSVLSHAEADYGIEWHINKNTITATQKDFGLDKNLQVDMARPLARCSSDDLLAWIERVHKRLQDLQDKRVAELYRLQEKGFEIHSISENGIPTEARIRHPGHDFDITVPLSGRKGLIGPQARAAIRQADSIRFPAVAPRFQADESHQAVLSKEVPKAELLLDNASLSILQAPRKANRTWLDILDMAKPLSAVHRIVLPSIIADFEIRGMMPSNEMDGMDPLQVVDAKVHNGFKSRTMRPLLEKATRVRITAGGDEKLIRQGDPKLVIFESASQDKVFADLRARIHNAQAAGTSLEGELTFFRSKEGEGANKGEEALFEYAHSQACKHIPIIVTDDYNTIFRHQFVAKHDPDQKLCTPNGHGISFATAHGLLRAVGMAYGPMAVHVLNRTTRSDEIDMSLERITREIIAKQKTPEKPNHCMESNFPDYISGHTAKGRDEPQLHTLLTSTGMRLLQNMGADTKLKLYARLPSGQSLNRC